jgi:bacterioferritin
MTDHSFSLDIDAIRQQARRDMQAGAVTGSYGTDPKAVIDVLNDVLATEIVCWMRYSRHAISASGISREAVSGEFSQHAEEERRHAMMAAERVSQLGGEPDFDPRAIATRAHATYETADDTDLAGMLRENLVAERIVISITEPMSRRAGSRRMNVGWPGRRAS